MSKKSVRRDTSKNDALHASFQEGKNERFVSKPSFPHEPKPSPHYLEYVKVTSFGKFANTIVGPFQPGVKLRSMNLLREFCSVGLPLEKELTHIAPKEANVWAVCSLRIRQVMRFLS